MIALRIFGFIFVLFGLLFGILIILIAPGFVNLLDKLPTIWVLFSISFLGGFVLLHFGPDIDISKESLTLIWGWTLFAIGLISFICIVAMVIGIFEANSKEGASSLWVLFFLCMLSGIGAIVSAEKGLNVEDNKGLIIIIFIFILFFLVVCAKMAR